MTSKVPVRVGETVFYAEVSSTGPTNVAITDMVSFDGVKDTIQAIATELAEAWRAVKPDEASVEFGLNLELKSGKLTGLLVEGKGSASLKVVLKWSGAK